jgi:hypothetical protein
VSWPSNDNSDPKWKQAASDAEQIAAEHPGWTVRPVRRYRGPGVEAWRKPDDGGVYSAMGTAAEVRSVLERVSPGHVAGWLAPP